MIPLFSNACIAIGLLHYATLKIYCFENDKNNQIESFALSLLLPPNGYHFQESKASPTTNISMSSYAQFPSFTWRSSEVDFANFKLKYNLSIPSNLDVCKNVKYFVFVPTRPSDIEARAAIRASWAEKPPQSFLVLFVVGKPKKNSKNSNVYNDLYDEWKRYNDIIFYDAKDEYRMLHVKIYAVLTWQQLYCSNVQFVIRADADTIINLDRLQYWMNNGLVPNKSENISLIFGYLDLVSGIKRDPNHKQYVSYQDYPSDILPPYVWGFFYGISNRAVKSILSVSHTVNGFSLDDLLYTGVLAEKAGVKVISATKYLELEFGDIEDKNRECDSKEKVPFVTALCCVDNPKKITNSFTIVKNVTCNSPVTVTPSIQQKV